MKKFRRIFGYISLAFLLAGTVSAQPLPACYHTLSELYDFIFELEANDSLGLVHIDSIGHSRGDQLQEIFPIYAVKISDNADVFENEPVMLVICHIHAEEVIGIELSVDYMTRLTSQYQQYFNIVNNTQIYFIPTMNPDGLEVISLGWDNTWRKNGYKPPEMGQAACNVHPFSGGDSCGVDLNRNFDVNWIYGDTLWDPTGNELYDYYRGPAPFSEPEDRAVRDFARQIHPALSIVYHSSRTGNVAEQGIVAWRWGYGEGPYKWAPDSVAISNINDPYCNLQPKYLSGDTYTRVFGGTHNGCLQDWFYQQLGCIQILNEVGPGGQDLTQPPCGNQSGQLGFFVDQLRPSLEWMHRRLINYGPEFSNQAAVLNINTRDAVTDALISAEWRNLYTWSPVLGTWTTNEQFGRATFHPPMGQITIEARKEGYVTTDTTVTINPSGVRNLTIPLQPLPWYGMTFHIRDSAGNPVQGRVHLDCEFPRWITVPTGGQLVNLPEGTYRVTIIPDDESLMVMWRDFDLTWDGVLDVWSPPAEVVWSENFENGLGNWTPGGNHNDWHVEMDTTVYSHLNVLSATPVSGPFWPYVYPNDDTTWIQSQTINVPGGNVAFLQFDRRGRMDIPSDSFLVELTLDGQVWQQVAGFSDMDVPWTRTYVDLSTWTPSYFYLRFRLQSDAALGEVGMQIDNLKVFFATDLDADDIPPGVTYSYRITSAYPNPFNPSTTISYEVAGAGPVSFGIYNITGQEVRRFEVEAPAAGRYKLVWNGANHAGVTVPSGLYFAQLRAKGHVATHKLLLLR